MSFFAGLDNIRRQILVRRKAGLGALIAGFCLAPLWQLYKRCGGPPIVVKTYRGTHFLLDPRSITSSRFVYEGRPDAAFIESLGAFGGADVAFADVGANVGMYSILLCRVFPAGWMFEPNPVAVRAIKRNLALNDAADSFVIVEKAVGDTVGTVFFPHLETADPAAQVTRAASDNGFAVPMTTLDETLPHDRDYVVKIDAEGFDAQVVGGMKRLLAAGRIRICLFECHTNETLADVLALIAPYDYAVMDGKTEIVAPTADRQRDLMIVKRSLIARYLATVSENTDEVIRVRTS